MNQRELDCQSIKVYLCDIKEKSFRKKSASDISFIHNYVDISNSFVYLQSVCHMFTWIDYIMLFVKPLVIFKKTILFQTAI